MRVKKHPFLSPLIVPHCLEPVLEYIKNIQDTIADAQKITS